MGLEPEEQERIERRAAQVLAEVPDYVWDGSSLPVPVEAIADSCFHLLIRDVEPHDMEQAPDCPPLAEGTSLSGLFLPREREIWVNAAEGREWPPRRRFSIGHELGHCVLHEDGQRSLFCRHGTIDFAPDEEAAIESRAASGGAADEDEVVALIEREANQFAAALLMPPELMRHHYRAAHGNFDELCRIFGSSQAAMGRRLHQAVPRGG